MNPLPHERRRYAEALRWLRDFAPGAVHRSQMGEKPIIAINPLGETELDDIHSPLTVEALTWAIEKLEE